MNAKTSSPSEKTHAETGGRRSPRPTRPALDREAVSLLGNQATSHLIRGSLGMVQPGLRTGSPEDVSEDEAAVADDPAAKPSLPEEDPESAPPEAASAPALIVDDEAENLEAGQMRKSEFLARLRPPVQAAVQAGDPALLDASFREYQDGDAARINRDLSSFVPEGAGITAAEDYIPLIAARAGALAAHEAAHGSAQGAAPEASGPPLTGDASKAPLWRRLRGALTGEDEGAPSFPVLSLFGCKKCPEPAKPPRLTKVTISGPFVDDPCGNFAWGVKWQLDAATAKGGWVVQHVETTFDIKDCNGNPVDIKTLTNGTTDPANWPLWEAWEVDRCEKATAKKTDDSYTMCLFNRPPSFTCQGHDSKVKTKGSISIKGTAEFFDGLSLPKSFAPTGKPPTGNLPVTRTPPTLGGGTGSLDHSLTATWDCCEGKDDKTHVKTT